jgi:hypothetical protein
VKGLGGGAADSLYRTQFHASLCLCVTDMGDHSTGGGIYQTALATRQTLAASVKQLTHHFISSAADNRVTMQIATLWIFYARVVFMKLAFCSEHKRVLYRVLCMSQSHQVVMPSSSWLRLHHRKLF